MTQPLMPMATAVWLVDNTGLTFRQIAEFCGIHELEVQGIADETIGANIVGMDPTSNGQLTREEIERCQSDAGASLTLVKHDVDAAPRTKGPRYTPVSKRQDKPDAIAWLLRHHPELSDLQVSRLVGTTKPTIAAIRDKSHWNIQNIKPIDPVALGLCHQSELDSAVRLAAERREKEAAKIRAAKLAAGEDVDEDAIAAELAESEGREPVMFGDAEEVAAQPADVSEPGTPSDDDVAAMAAKLGVGAPSDDNA